MKFIGALIKEQGQVFAIAMVKPNVISNVANREMLRNQISVLFEGVPVVLAEEKQGGRLLYNGRTDIVNFLSKLLPSQIPWKEYTLN